MPITPDPRDVEFVFIRAGGPGGQNVNKVSSAVQLRFDTRGFTPLADAVRERLARLAGRRLTAEGVLVLEARRFRTQERNRADALARLAGLLEAAEQAPQPRRPTKPTRASRQRRLEAKTQQGAAKRLRRKPDLND
ncbi:alternative ribosome rescue aminoacyl-tRNA hydrolase ArfB [Immundisolibacter sp.]|uniref:alternative ribosome rescue aminoacyl-tRNA hydrolase ArfB n=1 Tax=Immundisolibacter sp. TaxID=1934948 RepID=UPI002604528D|nr:alternative ribosome rescue aminoacyl-tRNA hydrolase ArfB [Immundisolibacter sp.]MDD3650904.1 alternative ribosome rescue aminoacyl-tRNA hydrolase ArfB [Immundisolibacter sp.]